MQNDEPVVMFGEKKRGRPNMLPEGISREVVCTSEPYEMVGGSELLNNHCSNTGHGFKKTAFPSGV